MIKKRIIPVILLKNGQIVQSRAFKRHQPIGSPTAAVERFSNWNSDELIYIDISRTGKYDLNRDDLNHPKFNSISDIIMLVSGKCFMPLTFGGGIRTMEDVEVRIKSGADKVSVNSAAIDNPGFITEIAEKFGSQCVVVSADVKLVGENKYRVFKRGIEPTEFSPSDFAGICEDFGAGEILLNSVDRDGSAGGYDIKMINSVCRRVNIPVIALGGAGNWEHFETVLKETDVSAAAAANIFQHSENSVYNCRKFLFDKGINVRLPSELSLEHNYL